MLQATSDTPPLQLKPAERRRQRCTGCTVDSMLVVPLLMPAKTGALLQPHVKELMEPPFTVRASGLLSFAIQISRVSCVHGSVGTLCCFDLDRCL
jgi:hypothetical protein